jgi:hypothetical protein
MPAFPNRFGGRRRTPWRPWPLAEGTSAFLERESFFAALRNDEAAWREEQEERTLDTVLPHAKATTG